MLPIWKRPAAPPAGTGLRLVIANRGEIARRVLAAGRRRGYRVAVISTPADAGALARREADCVLEVGDFLDAEAVVEAASGWRADLLHPGYGFLSENAGFAAAVEAAGIAFAGPAPESIRLLGGKEEARTLAVAVGVPVLPAIHSGEFGTARDPVAEVERRGLAYPLAVKAAAGGGGIGIRVVREPGELADSIESAARQAEAAFGDPTVFLERWLDRPRHIEIQVFGDGRGRGMHFGERECSVQRRRQKLVEWAPAAISAELRRRMGAAALRLMEGGCYRGAGTVEFLVEDDEFWFLEVNTRLQVEHPVTEAVQGVDLVDLQLELAEGRWPSRLPPAVPADGFEPREAHGAAIEVRVLAEAPRAGFAPRPAPILRYRPPKGVRCDSGIGEGSPAPPGFDSLLAKVIASGASFGEARGRLAAALPEMIVHGPETNLAFLISVLEHPDFRAGRVHTGWVGERLAELTAAKEGTLTGVLGEERARDALRDAASGRRGDPAASVFRSPGRTPAVPGPDPGDVLIGTAPAVVTELPSGVAVTLGGETVVLREETRSAGTGEAGIREVEAPMAGKVLRVCREPGAVVQRGEVVAVVESMKMHWDVQAPADGVLEAPEVSVGEIVAAGAVLMRIAPGP